LRYIGNDERARNRGIAQARTLSLHPPSWQVLAHFEDEQLKSAEARDWDEELAAEYACEQADELVPCVKHASTMFWHCESP
jgi:hypothetical protein